MTFVQLPLRFITALALALSLGAQAHQYAIANITVDHPWARSTAPLAKVGVVYFSVKNSGAADRLLSAEVDSALADKVSLHEMSTDAKGLMHMRELKDGIEILPSSTVELAPGGNHLMLEGLKQPLIDKQEFSLTLNFAKAGTVVVDVHVQSSSDAAH